MQHTQSDIPQIGTNSSRPVSRQQVLWRRVLQRRELRLTYPANSHLTHGDASCAVLLRRAKVAELQCATAACHGGKTVLAPREGKVQWREMSDVHQIVQ